MRGSGVGLGGGSSEWVQDTLIDEKAEDRWTLQSLNKCVFISFTSEHTHAGMFTALLSCKVPEIVGDSPNQNAFSLPPEFNEIPGNVN